MATSFGEEEFLACCGSREFAKEMAALGLLSCEEAVEAARLIWFNKVGVTGWLEAFGSNLLIGQSPSSTYQRTHPTCAQWSKGEQSTALATTTDTISQELHEWNNRYKQKFGFIFIICATGRSTPEILAELKRRYPNRPIVEFEIAAQEQMKITELRLKKLYSLPHIVASTAIDTSGPET
ncbi:hypothetical protein DCAR_0728715 [Daucus carota subsp. sativus]|uniref:2-oxo-4-hydroxy-4-carboxy-5-ureidoimidazoline decarboxylase n=1 Tax=Daucus carota subsp. sativus TaxID=79200 RepID=A0A164TSW3_DAUCS|nr:PREDICTED: uric acid degradation bifunctional protein TTL-like [Daucus carota subsp. sativus]WOH09259.1 hypothetical protein DCAR_0728715 [Daucus carota subsp. sativus]